MHRHTSVYYRPDMVGYSWVQLRVCCKCQSSNTHCRAANHRTHAATVYTAARLLQATSCYTVFEL